MPDVDADRDEAILEAIRSFVAAHLRLPDQRSWTWAGMKPSEKTVRNRFGSFRAAAVAARIELAD